MTMIDAIAAFIADVVERIKELFFGKPSEEDLDSDYPGPLE